MLRADTNFLQAPNPTNHFLTASTLDSTYRRAETFWKTKDQ